MVYSWTRRTLGAGPERHTILSYGELYASMLTSGYVPAKEMVGKNAVQQNRWMRNHWCNVAGENDTFVACGYEYRQDRVIDNEQRHYRAATEDGIAAEEEVARAEADDEHARVNYEELLRASELKVKALASHLREVTAKCAAMEEEVSKQRHDMHNDDMHCFLKPGTRVRMRWRNGTWYNAVISGVTMRAAYTEEGNGRVSNNRLSCKYPSLRCEMSRCTTAPAPYRQILTFCAHADSWEEITREDLERMVHDGDIMLHRTAKQTMPEPQECVLLKSDRVDVKRKMDELTVSLQKVKCTSQKRNKNRKTFSLAWQFSMGRSTNALMLEHPRLFCHPHPFRPGVGVWMGNVLETARPKWMKELYTLANDLLILIDPVYAAHGDWVVNFSCMNHPNKHYVLKHVDEKDVTFQYGVVLGDNHEGGDLRLWKVTEVDPEDRATPDNVLNYYRKVLKMDGRFAHSVSPFKGTRYSVIFYKVFDRNIKQRPKPVFWPAVFV